MWSSQTWLAKGCLIPAFDTARGWGQCPQTETWPEGRPTMHPQGPGRWPVGGEGQRAPGWGTWGALHGAREVPGPSVLMPAMSLRVAVITASVHPMGGP